jgi:hypothetical protein
MLKARDKEDGMETDITVSYLIHKAFEYDEMAYDCDLAGDNITGKIYKENAKAIRKTIELIFPESP